MEPQSWDEYYFKMKTFEIQQMQEEAALELSLLKAETFGKRNFCKFPFLVTLTSRKEAKSKPTINTLLLRSFTALKKEDHQFLYGQTLSQTFYSSFVFLKSIFLS